jgi:predicted dinucleotide-binding enzyme
MVDSRTATAKSRSRPSPRKTLIVGAGALGGIIGARLLAVGASVSLATRNATSAEEIKASGLRVTGIGVDLSIEAREVAPFAEYYVPGITACAITKCTVAFFSCSLFGVTAYAARALTELQSR